MSLQTYAYGVVILPPPDVIRELLTLRKRHPLLQLPSPPHITVKSPFYFRHTGAAVIEELERICAPIPPFQLTLRGLGFFDQSVIFVRVEESPELQALHEAVVDGLVGYVETISERFEKANFTAHITIAEKLTAEDYRAARAALAGYYPRRRFWVEEVHLLRGIGGWDITKTFRLGGEPREP